MTNENRKTKGNIIGVDIGSTSIKVLKLSKLGQNIRIDGYAIAPLTLGATLGDGSMDPEEIVRKIKQAIQQLGVNSKTPVAFSFLSSQVLSNEASFAKELTALEIEQQISNNLGKYTNSYGNDYHYDFVAIGESPDSTDQKYTIVSIKNDEINQKIQVIEQAGLIPKVAAVDDYAIQKVFPYVSSRFNDEHPIAVVDIGSSQTTFMLVKNGSIVHSETKRFGAESLISAITSRYNCSADEAENIIENGGEDYENYEDILANFHKTVCDEIELSARYSEDEFISEYAEVYVSGGAANTEGLIPYLTEHLRTTVSKLNPFSTMLVNPKIDDLQLRKDAPVLLTALGLALYNIESGLNLLPWREELVREQKRTYLTGAVIAILAGCGLTFGAWTYYQQDLSSNNDANLEVMSVTKQADQRLEELKDVTAKREQMIKRMELIQGLQSQRPVVVSLVNSVVQDLPPNAYLKNFSKDKDSFSFEGKASDATVVAEFMRSLKKTGWFTNIFMSSYIAYVEPTEQKVTGGNTPEDKYGSFIVTADLLQKHDDQAAQQNVIVVRETSVAATANQAPVNSNVQAGEPSPSMPTSTTPNQPQNLPPMPVADPRAENGGSVGQPQNSRAIINGGNYVQK